MTIAARAPNHLGDGVMALPAMHALAARGELVIHAPPWGPDLYREVPADVVARGRIRAETAVLFAPSLRAAWEARGVRTVIGTPTDARSALLTVRVPEARHRADTYAALARAAGADPRGTPVYGVRGVSANVPEGHLALGPVTGHPRAWSGFRALAERIGLPAVWYAGPGERAALMRAAGPGVDCVGQSLPDLAATLARAAVWVGNDGGLSHLARAVGVPAVIVFGSTDPARTGPAGAVAVVGPRVPCAPCYRSACAQRLGCLEVSVERVEAAVRAVLEGR